MKKTLLALAVPAALAAGSASAAINVYNANGVTVDIGGSAEVQYIKKTDETLDPTLRIDDGDLLVNTSVEVAPGLKAVAGIGFFFESDDSDQAEVKADELFVGFASDFGTLTFGRQYTIADDMGNGKDYELGEPSQFGVYKTAFGDMQSNRVIKWRFDQGNTFYGAVSAFLDDDSAKDSTGGHGFDGMIGARLAGFDGRIFAYTGSNMKGRYKPADDVVLLQNMNGFNLELDYAINAFDFSASYGYAKFEDNAKGADYSGDIFATTYQLSAGYQATDRTYFAAGAYFVTTDAGGSDKAYQEYDSHSIYTNVTYALHSNAKIYGEIGITDQNVAKTEQNVKDLGYVLGMEVTF